MEIFSALLFSLALIAASFAINRYLIGGRLVIDGYRLALTASAVLLLAVVAESLINPLYEQLFGGKLWEYRVFPLHDSNVSALAAFVWTAYGVHLYFTGQSLDLKLGGRWSSTGTKALIVSFEAPFVFEVSGNLLFLQLMNNYYAYYLPSDVYHLTSFRVVPVYIFCIFFGMVILKLLEQLPRYRMLPPALFAGGIAYLFAGAT
ncbi:hypothetical protein DFR30_0672 [Thiogranum longum]|uniref:Uncharacterized protein n=1 Tax=Thiogranum longum TaxID=1537524 RepID=A0A4R1HJP1_9GAMM|nr:hypothetical protein [Thiogranum longum]TCK17442.1 hypothetical protein DFR30_0672 [Thiogranum longum]